MTGYTDVEDAADGSSVSERVVAAVATATDTDPTELPPLYGVVDPDCLDTLFRATQTGFPRAEGLVIFMMNGCEVTVDSNGTVDVTPPHEVNSEVRMRTPAAD